jgi:endoglucanase
MRCGRRTFLVGGLAAASAAATGGLSAAASALTVLADETGHRATRGPLRTHGAHIVDRDGDPVRLAGVNWYGFETAAMVAGGLDLRSIDEICARVADLGFTVVRLPFSVETVRSDVPITAGLDREPALRGSLPVEVMDRVVAGLERHGLAVILDGHRSDASWSLQGNGLWYTPEYAESVWVESWLRLVDRYRDAAAVVGCDLRNEPGSPPQDGDAAPRLGGAQWGAGGDGVDWAAAAERCGNAILDQDDRLLICVEGVRDDPAGPWFDGALRRYWPGGNLSGVGRAGGARSLPRPVRLRVPHRLVYSVHDYGPDMARALPWAQLDGTAASARACREVWDQAWGYLVREDVAPVWVGEFGTPNGRRAGDPRAAADFTDPNDRNPQGAWFSYLVDYIRELGLSWSIWALNGTQSPGPGRTAGAPEWYGVLGPDWMEIGSAPMMARLRTIMRTG